MERESYQEGKGTILQTYVMSARHMLCGKHITSSKEAVSYWLQTAFPSVNDDSEPPLTTTGIYAYAIKGEIF